MNFELLMVGAVVLLFHFSKDFSKGRPDVGLDVGVLPASNGHKHWNISSNFLVLLIILRIRILPSLFPSALH